MIDFKKKDVIEHPNYGSEKLYPGQGRACDRAEPRGGNRNEGGRGRERDLPLYGRAGLTVSPTEGRKNIECFRFSENIM